LKYLSYSQFFSKIQIAYLFLIITTPFFAQNKTIKISFNPDINKPYEYKTETISKIDEGFNTQNAGVRGSYSTTFKKEGTDFLATDIFSQLEISSGSKMIFSLNLCQAPRSRQQVLKEYFETTPLVRRINKEGTQIEGWDTSFILYHPNLRGYDKERILQVVKQLNNPTRTFYIDKTIKVGTTFFTQDIVSATQLNVAPKSLKIESTLVDIRGHQAIFTYKSSFYLPIRNRKKEIIGKKEVTIDGMTIIDSISGMPVEGRMILRVGESYAITTFVKKGEKMIRPYICNAISNDYGKYYDMAPPSEDQKEKSFSEVVIATKEKAEEKLHTLTPFLHLTKSSHRGCGHIVAELSQFKYPIAIQPNFIKGLDENNETLFYQKVEEDFTAVLYDYEWDDLLPLSASYCDMPLSKAIYNCRLSIDYGVVKESYLKNEYDTLDNKKSITNILDWRAERITVSDRRAEYYDENDERIYPIRIRDNYLPTDQNMIYNIPAEDITATDCFLFMNTFTAPEDNRKSITLEFNKEVTKVVMYKAAGTVDVEKEYTLLPKVE